MDNEGSHRRPKVPRMDKHLGTEVLAWNDRRVGVIHQTCKDDDLRKKYPPNTWIAAAEAMPERPKEIASEETIVERIEEGTFHYRGRPKEGKTELMNMVDSIDLGLNDNEMMEKYGDHYLRHRQLPVAVRLYSTEKTTGDGRSICTGRPLGLGRNKP